ncbi:C-X-C chemokine receptor type 2-like [Epinephelus lanceolatus]
MGLWLPVMGGVKRHTAFCSLPPCDIPSASHKEDNTMTDPTTSSIFIDFGSIYEELNFTYNDSEFIINPETQPCNPFSAPDAVMVVVSVFYVIIFLLAIPGNLVVGLVICLSKQSLPPSDLYLLHLAIADLLLAITLPFWATSVTKGWVFGDAMCKIVTVLQELSFYSSILFLTCISMDRYMVIVRAMEARRANRQLVSWGVCAAVWAVGVLLSLPGLFNSASQSQNSSQIACAELYDPGSADVWRLATRILRHALGFFIPLAIMLPCYGVTIQRLLHIRGGFQRQRAMRVIVCVVVAFLLCWTPYHIAVMADTFFRAKIVPYGCPARMAVDQAMFATQSLGLLHSCVNPVLYAFVGEKFRKNLLQKLRKMGILGRASVSRTSRSSLSSEITSTVM